jgi:ABC-type oligopeptide transport system ATPase subunit
MSVLELRDVEVTYERRGREPVRAVAGVSLSLEPGQFVGLVGESGCGKSTLAKAVVGLVPASAGKILFEGREVGPLTRRARPRELVRLQMVFQNPFSSLNPRRRIGAQLAEAMLAAGFTRRVGRGRVTELLELVGLSAGAAERYPHQFSGGQRQRIGLARALALNPSFIVADEPVSALDVSVQAQVINLLMDLQQRLKLTYLFIAHDLRLVRHICRRVAVMYLGKLVEMGETESIFAAPAHPYTRALLSAIPLPDPAAPRHRVVLDPASFEREAPLRQVGANHLAAV